MDSNHPSERFLVAELRKGREGVQCERSLRTLSFLLGGWERFERESNDKKTKKGSPHLRAIQFDKLGAFTFRLQNELFRHKGMTTPKGDATLPIDDSQVVTHPSPFKELPGKHGRGPARWDEVYEPIYLVDIVYRLQKEGILNYFEVSPPDKDPDNPNNPMTTIRSASPVTLNGFTELEKEILIDLQNSLRHLNPKQIRALGTHENFEKTLEDAKREFMYMGRFLKRTIKSIEKGEPFLDAARELMEYADEAWRKSQKNRDRYKEARTIMLREINNIPLREAFENCQAPHDQIWGRPEMEAIAHTSEKAQSFTKYLYAIAYYQSLRITGTTIPARELNKFTTDWEKTIDSLEKCGLQDFPREINDIFENTTGTIYPEIRARLISQLREFIKGAS